MNMHITRLAVRSGVAAATAGALFVPALLATPSEAAASPQARKARPSATSSAHIRPVSPPNTFFPVAAGRSVSDQRSFSTRHRGTDLVAPCGSPVVAAHAGTVKIETNSNWASPYVVRVVTRPGGLITSTAYLASVTVANGQIIAPGQQIGTVGARSKRQGCRTYVSVSNNGRMQNPSAWLNTYVGKPAPVGALFGDPGFAVASFNVLGATHTRRGGTFPVASARMPATVKLLESHKVDVAGLQEFQDEQKAQFLDITKGSFGVYNFRGPKGKEDTDNAIIWRKSAFEFVRGDTFDVPYFNGNIRHMPIVLLRSKATGRTAYFINTHNPADVRGPAQQWRDKGIRIQRAKVIELRQTGRPVFLTGDFNDRQEAFCPLTADMLMISPNSIPSATTCLYPKQGSIDWIFAAGQTRFSFFVRDNSPLTNRISDHPIIVAKAHLQY